MNLKDMIIDSIKYPSSNWKEVILLGTVLLIADGVNEFQWTGQFADEIRIALIIIGSFLAILQAGYLFCVVEETIKGSKKPPKIKKLKNMFIHGIKEIIVSVTYVAIAILLIIVVSIALASISPSELIALISMVIIGLSIGLMVSILCSAAILNMVNRNGSLRAGFDLKKIFKKIRRVEIKRFLFVYFGFLLAFSIVGIFLSDYILPNIPLMGDLISQLVIAPYILISTTRFLGLLDRS